MIHWDYCIKHSQGMNCPFNWCYVERQYVCRECGCGHADCFP